MFDKGDRVLARFIIDNQEHWEPGTINYRRMAPPDFKRVEAYSVILDSKKDDPGYAGTIRLAESVKEES